MVRRTATRLIVAHEAVIHAHRDLGLTHEHDVHEDGQTDVEWCSYMDHRSWPHPIIVVSPRLGNKKNTTHGLLHANVRRDSGLFIGCVPMPTSSSPPPTHVTAGTFLFDDRRCVRFVLYHPKTSVSVYLRITDVAACAFEITRVPVRVHRPSSTSSAIILAHQ